MESISYVVNDKWMFWGQHPFVDVAQWLGFVGLVKQGSKRRENTCEESEISGGETGGERKRNKVFFKKSLNKFTKQLMK